MDWRNPDEMVKAGLLPRLAVGTETTVDSIIAYVAGCVKRERERLARVLREAGQNQRTIDAILSEEDDAKVFRWRCGNVGLNDPE